MKTGIDVVNFAKTLVGCKYVLGANVPKNQVGYKGPFDCAEFVSYANFQTFGILYGCDTDNVAKAAIADAYTGYFSKDAHALGIIITPAQAAQIPGAMLLRLPVAGTPGHIIFAEGSGKSVEANCTKYGCIESVITGRRFDLGILLPGIQYDKPNLSVVSVAPAIVYRLKVPMMIDPFVGKIQKALGFIGNEVDNEFGMDTHNAVMEYQRAHGLVVDGEVMPGGQTAKALNI